MRILPIIAVVRVSFLVLLAVFAGSAAPAFADDILVVVPNSKENAAGTGSQVPLSYLPARYQQLNSAAEFGAITAPSLITQIAFRAGFTSNPFTHTVADLQINLSTAAVTPLSGTFATNVGSDDTIVYRGALAMDVVSPKTGGVRPWEIFVPLDTPFLYDPSAGDLLLEMRVLDNPNGGDAKFVDSLTIPVTLARVFCTSGCSVDDSGGNTDGGFLITRFTFAPEPEAGVAGAAVILVLGATARRRARACPS